VTLATNSSNCGNCGTSCPTGVPCMSGTCMPQYNNTATFTNTNTGYTGTLQSWTVPSNVTSIIVEAWGAQGGGSPCGCCTYQPIGAVGRGAYIKGTVTVSPGDAIDILVGQMGFVAGYHGNENGGGGGTFVVKRS